MISDSRLAEAFWRDGRCDDCPVIDMHGHMGRWKGIRFPKADTDAMIGTMDRCGVRMLVFCHHDALFCPDVGNAANVEAVRRHPHRLRAYLGINPNTPDAIAADLESFDEYPDVYVGLKMLSPYHQSSLTDAAYERAWAFANERKLLVLSHTWGMRESCGPGIVREIAGKHPDLTFLAGHSMHGEWDEACAVARDHPNVYLELCAVLDDRGAMETFAEAGLGDRMLFGTDLPWFDPAHGFGAVFSADLDDETRRNILHRNAQRLLAAVGVNV